MDAENVAARAAVSNLTAAQVAQRQRDLMLYQIQSFDAAFSQGTLATSARASGAGTTDPAWLNGIGAQFAVRSSGLSGEQRKANHEKVCSDASDRNVRLLTVKRSETG